ncbi:hypothetical protein GOBAR_AA26529 [Gossypium barbadense]|uniref:EGF-like domain-containing protein n=1 Tax=Gossypium barbadense TaxID=3634 RepID=A0A2P5WSU3_GOSBA|nr:hypothetical protein GOBAR_AA26529 [Gossypium barbadense]
MELKRLLHVVLSFWLLLCIGCSDGRFVVEKNSLTVTSPEKIKGTYDSAIDCFFALKVWNVQKAGASAVLVADDIEEALITMDTPEEDSSSSKYIENITIPSALIQKSFGEALKKAISGADMVNVNLDWRESVPHPDDRVEYELWTNSNDECGVKCDMLMEFVKDFKGAAQILEKGGYTQFTPHYMTWYCPQAFTISKQCKSQCINHGRYCAPDPEQDFSSGYEGKDVVIENLRQLCVFKVANESNKSWLWWDYVTDFQIRCPMKEKKYNKECADAVIKSLGLDSKKIEKCMVDPNADADNPVLKEEQNAQHTGKLAKGAVLKAICSGFEETTEPAVCLSDGMAIIQCYVELPRENQVSALIQKSFGEALKKAISGADMVNVNLDWRESVPHPDDRVEYELWTNSNDECGVKCDMLMEFVKDFKGAAQILEKGGYTQFTPHYMTWYCPQAFTISKQCKSQCINHGRYCAPDPEQDFSSGYEGKDVVIENLRQLCVFKVANESNKSWLWWDYVTDFQIRCPMKEKKYNKECADAVIKSLCYVELPRENQVNLCGGMFTPAEITDGWALRVPQPALADVTKSSDVETNECLDNNGGCWQDKAANLTACKDTFRGRVCECPLVDGLQFKGDGYSHCEASGPGRCNINNGGCWHKSQDGHTYSACVDTGDVKCQCPPGFRGDGINSCDGTQTNVFECKQIARIFEYEWFCLFDLADIDECKEKKACQCPECSCKDTWGSYECTCSGDLLYIRDHDTCISKSGTEVKSAWAAVWVILIGLAMASGGAYLVYKYRLRSYMDSEIRAIMAQYMPLDSQSEVPNHVSEDRA